MTFGEIVYRMQATRDGFLPKVHGRFMHAAFFAALQERSAEMSAYIHDEMNAKPFTVSSLRLPPEHAAQRGGKLFIAAGTEALWRVTAFSDALLRCMTGLPPGYVFRIGQTLFQLLDLDVHTVDEPEFIAKCLETGCPERIELNFLSPVSFRSFEDDYPLPLPELIWGSFVDKWLQMGMEVPLDKEQVRRIAARLVPVEWAGRSERIFFSRSQGVTGFRGNFAFSLQHLQPEERRLLFLLAQFSYFSGTGRLTAQGLGQTRIFWK